MISNKGWRYGEKYVEAEAERVASGKGPGGRGEAFSIFGSPGSLTTEYDEGC